MVNNLSAHRIVKLAIACFLLSFIVLSCKTARETGNVAHMPVPDKLTPEENHKLRQLLTGITNATISDTFLIKHYHSHDDCWSTRRYQFNPDVLGNIKRQEKWFESYARMNPHITVLQVRQPGSGPLKYIKRNYNVKVDIKKTLLQFPMFAEQPCNIVWLVMPDGTLYKIKAQY